MGVTYAIAVDLNDDGDFSDLGEAVTGDVLAVTWRLGMAQPYDSVAPPAYAAVTLINTDGAYAPERTASGLLPGKRLRIQSDDGATVRTHFTGFISHIELVAGDQGSRTAVIHARSADAQLDQHRIRLPALVNISADAVITAVLDAVPLRRAELKGYWIVGVVSHAELGTNTRLAVSTIARSLESGRTTLAYVGDTWSDGIPANDAIRQVVEAERGRFFINRDGQAVFYNRHHTLLDASVDAAFTDDMDGMAYAYGVDLANSVQVRVRPRSVGAPGTTLWSLEDSQQLPGPRDAVRSLVAGFRDDQGRPIGALAVILPQPYTDYTANTQPDGSGVDQTALVSVRLVTVNASAASLEITNRSGQPIYLLAGSRLRGTPLYQGDPITVEQVDPTSQTFYGPHMLTFDLPGLTALEEADSLARFERARRHSPRGIVRSLQLNAHHSSSHRTQVLTRTLFDRITITESQTGHSADYFIAAEQHLVDQGGTRHQVTWLLESADYSAFFIIGTSKLGQTTTLAY